ncbi:hypothetical protein ABZV31_17170 [Streptomyces sp. NPDC005202]|uniref:hypothetical protein n=1 Tax=Streptomyces sp. NPDC005202 TaxID=3157021 RepID=UPI0033B1FD17
MAGTAFEGRDASDRAELLRALDAVPWERLGLAREQGTPEDVSRALRRIARQGPDSAEDDCSPLFGHLAPGNGRLPSAATAALPFVLRLAADPGVGARVGLVALLAALVGTAATAEAQLVDAGWPAAWARHRAAAQALLADPDPEVRYVALPLAADPGHLLERWRAEENG